MCERQSNPETSAGDTIIQFSSAYGACEKTIQYICETTPAKLRNIDVTFPMDYNVLVYMFRHAVHDIQKQGGTAKLAMFDTVVTFPGTRLPWEELVKACQELSVLSLIDGAHGIGHIDLTHLASVNPDFFTSNCYK
jgi:selenocysteine lyase/cysteine desulfurase